MSVKFSMTPCQAAAVFKACCEGVTSPDLTAIERRNAVEGLERMRRRLDIHRVDLAWADETGAKSISKDQAA